MGGPVGLCIVRTNPIWAGGRGCYGLLGDLTPPRTTRNSLLSHCGCSESRPEPLFPPPRALSPGEDLWAEETFSPFALLRIKRQVAVCGHITWRRHWRAPGSKGSGTGFCKATKATSTSWLVMAGGTLGGVGTASLSLQAVPRTAQPSAAALSPFPQELSLSIPIFSATAPRRAQQRNYSGAAQHAVSSSTTRLQACVGTGLGTPAGLQDIATQRERRWGATRTDGTFAKAPAKQRSKFSPCWDQTFPVHSCHPSPRDPEGLPAHRLARKADFHERINKVLLVALEAKNLPDVVHDGIIHWEGKEMLKVHESTWCPDGPSFPCRLSHHAGCASPLSQVGMVRRLNTSLHQ